MVYSRATTSEMAERDLPPVLVALTISIEEAQKIS